MGNKLFGTDGVRGRANVYPMTVDFALKLAKAIGVVIKSKNPKVAIAKDTRISGDMLEAALTSGLTAMGVDVVILGVIPTPVLTYLTPRLGVDMSIMVSASHNPFYDNGIKLVDAQGNKLSDEATAQLEELVLQDNFEFNSERIGRYSINKESVFDYLKMVSAISEKPMALSGLKIVLDCANGAFTSFAPQVFKDYGADVIVIGNTPDGYNINKDCGSTSVDLLKKTVLENHADIGLAFDGDGDRLIVCDEKANRIDGDQLIGFLAQYFNAQGLLKGNTVVATILSNMGLDKFLKSMGIKCVRAAVGEKNVIVKMKEFGANVGGEESGHVVLSDYSITGDALVNALVLSLGLVKSGKKMSHIFPAFEFCPFVFKSIRFQDKDKVAVAMDDNTVKVAVAKAKEALGENGFVVLHKSGTEPLLRVRVDGEDKKLVEELALDICEKVEAFSK